MTGIGITYIRQNFVRVQSLTPNTCWRLWLWKWNYKQKLMADDHNFGRNLCYWYISFTSAQTFGTCLARIVLGVNCLWLQKKWNSSSEWISTHIMARVEQLIQRVSSLRPIEIIWADFGPRKLNGIYWLGPDTQWFFIGSTETSIHPFWLGFPVWLKSINFQSGNNLLATT